MKISTIYYYYLHVIIIKVLLFIVSQSAIDLFPMDVGLDILLIVLPSVAILIFIFYFLKRITDNIIFLLILSFVTPVCLTYFTIDRVVFFGFGDTGTYTYFGDLYFSIASVISIPSTYYFVKLIERRSKVDAL
jgi:hypothetical protein